ncbi:MAG: hypothetical protein GOV02_00405, partial [Candidatus Aenigmarchaeota archaeon]|nr:hypothetical protein [Candidatus Aenigmarchaeota archaeon]
MTNLELHDLVDILLDKYQAPWFDATEKDRFLNLALMEYVKENYSKFELDEKVKQNILPLVRTIRVAGPTSVFSTETLPNFMFFLSMNGFFNDPDCNRTVKDVKWNHDSSLPNTAIPTTDAHPLKADRANLVTKTTDTTLTDTIRRSIQPIQLDDISTSAGDPFNKPEDEHPKYVARADHKGHQFIQIYSDTEPLFIDVD